MLEELDTQERALLNSLFHFSQVWIRPILGRSPAIK